MIARALHVPHHLLLVREHAKRVQRPRAGYEIALVGVFARELVADQMAAVEEELLVDPFVAGVVPAGRADRAHVLPLLQGQGLRADARESARAAAERVKRPVVLIRFGGLHGKGDAAVDLDGRCAFVGRQLRKQLLLIHFKQHEGCVVCLFSAELPGGSQQTEERRKKHIDRSQPYAFVRFVSSLLLHGSYFTSAVPAAAMTRAAAAALPAAKNDR